MNHIEIFYYFGSVVLLATIAIFCRIYKPAYYAIAKPLPMFWILYWCLNHYYQIGYDTDNFLAWILGGLVAGLWGDVFLLNKKTLLLGFIGFSAGHIAYLIAFAKSELVMPAIIFGFLLLPGLAYAIIVGHKSGQKKYAPFIWAYCLIISLMLAFAINTFISNQLALYLMIGCFLFCISDGFWLWNKFAHKIPLAGVWILTTYYLAQALIVFGAFVIVLHQTPV